MQMLNFVEFRNQEGLRSPKLEGLPQALDIDEIRTGRPDRSGWYIALKISVTSR
jgi:hypothetical protein